ncbi:MAG: hypothetical protein SF028_04575 [Candidatus Sumerlaeia bacterium]|nr:hypothetical protein [Candidatus Sumerlaeia bacterium]
MSERGHTAAKIIQDIELLRKDVEEMMKLSRTWPQTGRAATSVRELKKDLQASYQHAVALAQEIARMDSQHERLESVGGCHRVEASYERIETRPVQDLGPIPMAHRREAVGASPRGVAAPLPDPPTAPPMQVELSAPPPPPRDPNAKDLSKIATNLPPHVLEELRKKGFA